MTRLFDLVTHAPSGTARIDGVVTGIVTNIQDPDGLGRIKVRLPWLSDQDESNWARLASPMAGKDRGLFLLPEIDDEVLVIFEHGDPRFPIIIGGLWNGAAKPPEGDGDHRVLRSRSGHVIRLVDAENSEKIEIVDKSGETRILLDTANHSLTIESSGDMTLDAKGELSISAETISISAKGQTTIKGLTVDIN